MKPGGLIDRTLRKATAGTGSEPTSNIEWRLFGKRDVGVSHDYEAGHEEWQVLADHLRQYGLTRWDTCCEIGCGVGRMTNAAAADFREVHALDVSADRIAQARTAPNAARCTFHQVTEPAIPLADESCDLVMSVHVFQHISSNAAIASYFRDAFRVLRPGGVLLVHLPTIGAHGRTGKLGEVLGRSVKDLVKNIALTVNRPLSRAGLPAFPIPIATYRVFNFPEVEKQLEGLGFRGIELRILPVRDCQSYFFARRIAA